MDIVPFNIGGQDGASPFGLHKRTQMQHTGSTENYPDSKHRFHGFVNVVLSSASSGQFAKWGARTVRQPKKGGENTRTGYKYLLSGLRFARPVFERFLGSVGWSAFVGPFEHGIRSAFAPATWLPQDPGGLDFAHGFDDRDLSCRPGTGRGSRQKRSGFNRRGRSATAPPVAAAARRRAVTPPKRLQIASTSNRFRITVSDQLFYVDANSAMLPVSFRQPSRARMH